MAIVGFFYRWVGNRLPFEGDVHMNRESVTDLALALGLLLVVIAALVGWILLFVARAIKASRVGC
jgi:hypothetical protein